MSDIRLSVEYYNDEEKELFQKFPNSHILNQAIGEGVSISKDDFFAYMMFTWQMDVDGFRTFVDLAKLVSNNLGIVNKLFTFNNGSLQARVIGNNLMQTGYTERIGVALGLCLINKLHSLTAADWKKIPTSPGRKGYPTFDFSLPFVASTGCGFIEVENKGCAIENNTEKTNSIKNHYLSIKRKKEYISKEEKLNILPLHQNLYYGTIGVIDNRANSNAKVWLIDPPAFDIKMDPKKYKLLARLHFYLDEFKNIGIQKNIITGLERRIDELTQAGDFMTYNLKSLIKNDRKFVKGDNQAIVDTDEAFGRIFFVYYQQKQQPYLIAYTRSIIKLIIKQDFDAILQYSYDPDFINEHISVLMKLRDKSFIDRNLQSGIETPFNEKTKLYEIVYFSKVMHTTDGRIFGLLKNERFSK